MRRRFAFLLLALYMCTTTEAYQLLKIPLLAMHFVQHRQADPGITPARFIAMHYTAHTVYDDDWQQDMQLPFKTCSLAEISLPACYRAEPLVVPAPATRPLLSFYNPLIPSMQGITGESEIFQPPRPAFA